jgi:hypothetical protein
MSMAIWIVVLLSSSHLVFVTKPAPTRDSVYDCESHLFCVSPLLFLRYVLTLVYQSISLLVYGPIDLQTYRPVNAGCISYSAYGA